MFVKRIASEPKMQGRAFQCWKVLLVKVGLLPCAFGLTGQLVVGVLICALACAGGWHFLIG
jgi:hypothetical protein